MRTQIATFGGLGPSETPGGSVGGGRNPGNDDQERLIFPLLAEPTPRPRWVSELVVGTVILALLSVAVLVAVSQLRPVPTGKLAVGMIGLDGRQLDHSGNRARTSAFDLEPGTCLQDYDGDTDIREVPVVPCDVEHHAEAVATLWMPEGAWPGRNAIDEFAAQRCVRAIYAAGVKPTRALKWSYVGPSATSWAVRDDRVVNCLVVSEDEPLIGSLLVEPQGRTGRDDDS